MNILFFLPELLRSYKEIPSLTVAQFKSYLDSIGYSTKILLEKNVQNKFDDETGKKLVRECVLKANYLLGKDGGQKVMLISSWYYNLPFALEFIKEYRKAYDDETIIILGGYAATNSADVIFKILGDDLDFIVRGNGYLATRELLDYIKTRRLKHSSMKREMNIKGVCYLEKNQEKGPLKMHDGGLGEMILLDDLPIPDYSFTGESLLPSLYMKTSDGCGYNSCHFCTSEKFNRYQEKSKSRVEEELLEYKRRYGTKVIQFTDNTFLCNEKRAILISEFLKKEGFVWSCYSRIEIKESLLKTMIKNNCKKIFFGYDTPSEKDFTDNDKSKIDFASYKDKSKRLFLLMSELKRADPDFYADFAIIDFTGKSKELKNEYKKGIRLHKSKLQYIPGTKYYSRNPEKFIFDDNTNFFYSKYEHYFRNNAQEKPKY